MLTHSAPVGVNPIGMIYSTGDGGLFGLLMRTHISDRNCDDEMQAVVDAEAAFEAVMAQTARTEFDDDLHVRLALSALIGAWGCVTRARAAAGH